MENNFVRKLITIRADQETIIKNHSLNFSKFVQNKLDELENNSAQRKPKQEAKNANSD